MRVVIQRTGLSPDLLRAWERRYHVVRPTRTDGGQRLYSDADVERLARLARATAGGRSIGQIVSLSVKELERLIAEDEAGRAGPSTSTAAMLATAEYFREAAGEAAARLDALGLEALLRRAAMHLSATTVIDEVIVPLLRDVGDRWHRGELTPAHEHLGSVAIRRALAWMMGSAMVPAGAPTAIVATPAGQRHELAAKIVATTASNEGWRVIFLGSDLPADVIAAAARQSAASLVALSVIFPMDEAALARDLIPLARLIPPEVTLVAGGAGLAGHEVEVTRAGIRVIADLAQFRILLRSLHPAPPPYR